MDRPEIYGDILPIAAYFPNGGTIVRWRACAHLAGRDDGLVRVAPLIERVGRFSDLIGVDTDLRCSRHCVTRRARARPLGTKQFVADLERLMAAACGGKRRGRKASGRTGQ